MSFDPAIERAKIERDSDLSDAEIMAAQRHLRDMLRSKGRLSGCTSYVQRKMQIGYTHAARLLAYLEAVQFITDADSAGLRHPGPAWPDGKA